MKAFDMQSQKLMDAFGGMWLEVVKLIASQRYICLAFDGWSRSQGSNHLLGYTATNACSGVSCFLDFVATDDKRCTAAFMCEELDRLILKHHLVGKVSSDSQIA